MMVPLERTLRDGQVLRALDGVLTALHSARADFRVIAYSIQHNHMHLVVEADGPAAFSSGVRALCIRIARRVNRALHRRGRLFLERHHRRVLPTPREVRNGFSYALLNRRRHLGELCPRSVDTADPYSSSEAFDGWLQLPRPLRRDHPPRIAPPRTWLARIGWRPPGVLPPGAIPRLRPSRGLRENPRRET